MYLHQVVGALERLPAGYNPDGLPPMQVIDASVEAGVLVEEAGLYRSAFLRSMNTRSRLTG